MKRKSNLFRIISVICGIMLYAYACGQEADSCGTGGQTCYFAVEINGVLCGYTADTYREASSEGRKIRCEDSDVFLKMKLLGADMEGGFRYRSVIDLTRGRAEKLDISVINGESVSRFITRVSGDTAFFESPTSGVSKTVVLGEEVIISSLMWYAHLIKDFIRNESSEKRYRVYDPIKGDIVEKVYVRKPDETIILRDSSFKTMVFEETDLSSALKSTLWLRREDGYCVRTVVANRNIYLADKSVTSGLAIADLDKDLFCSVGKELSDLRNLSSVRVSAIINSYGDSLTVESLKSPGQSFSGTVKGSLIEGVFETSPVRYSGKDAPPFPSDYSKSPGLVRYLTGEVMIESDEPEIIALSGELVRGSKDSWEAAVRLSRWVTENIAGVLPGGISAINTLRTGGAECGGHSRLLAALCRAAGIPARVVVGCMYTPFYSGSFGQHAWTEVYMGKNGWIAVDATINEPDYIDGGHIRLGEDATFRPVTMELLDYRYAPDSDESHIPDDLRSYTGSYMNVETYRIFKVIWSNGGLALSIPGRPTLDLNPPAETGRWYPKLTRAIWLEPHKGHEGLVDLIRLHQHYLLRKDAAADTLLMDGPGELMKYTGRYQFAPARLFLEVSFSEGILTTNEPLGRSKERISYSLTGDTWTDETGSYEISFVSDTLKGKVSLNLDVILEFLRGEPVINAVEEAIRISGVAAGLSRYDEIKRSGDSCYFFSVQMLHQLGHTMMKDNRLDDAITIFAKNTDEYPDSFMANDALAEAYLRRGDRELALRYFTMAVKLNPEYEYGKEKIAELSKK